MSLDKANVLYWNCQGHDGEPDFQNVLFDMLRNYKIDIFCLDESVADKDEFCDNLNTNSKKYIVVGEGLPLRGHGKIRVFSNMSKRHFSKKKVSDRFVKLHFKKRFDLCFVHFKSMANTDEYEKLKNDENVLFFIYKASVYEKKFLIGDFNATPYSKSFLDSSILNTIRIGEEKFKIKRNKLSQHKRINPSWSGFFENANGVYGTHARNWLTNDNVGLQLFDQVIFDDGLQTFYTPNSFKIISNVGGKSLLNDELEIEQSDHLPIFFSLENL